MSDLLLALTVLANFFNAIVATLFIGPVIVTSAIHCWRARERNQRREARLKLLAQVGVPLDRFSS